MKTVTTVWPALIVFLVVSCSGRSAADKAAVPKADTASTGGAGEPREAGEKTNGTEDVVTLSPEIQRRLGIVVTPTTEAPLSVPLEVTGSIQPIDSRVTHVRPLARGRVQQVAVRLGDRVTRGQELALFDNMEAGELATQHETARADLARLRVQLANAARQAERSRKLVEIGAVPQKDFEAAVAEQQQLEESVRGQESTVAGIEARLHRYGIDTTTSTRSPVTTIRSPFTGVVTHISAAPGDVVDTSSDLFSIADLSRVYVQAQVYEKDLGRVRAGQPATIMVDAYPDERFVGRVSTIGDVVDPQTRTVAVRCDVPNPKGLLKLDMFARIDLPTDTTRPALAVPTDAIQTFENKRVVFVQSGPSEFTVRPIEVGRLAGPLTEVTRGLKPGDPVVTRGAFQVKSALSSKALGEKE